jgi:hypothetical protein
VGKLGKEEIDQIKTLLGEGYNKTEVATRLGINRKTVATYAIDTGPSLVQVDSGKVSLSLGDDVTKILYDMMGVMGNSSIIGAVKQAYQNTVSLAKLRVTHWPVHSEEGEVFTAEAMIEHLVGFIEYLETEQREWFNALREAVAENERLKELAEERYEEGFEQGRQDHGIFVRCVYCGKPYQVVPLSKAHGLVTQTLLENGWGHISCINQAEYESEKGSRALRAEIMR